jgi:hypothetical protein
MTQPNPAVDMRAAAQLLLDLADETDEEIKTNTYWHSELRPPEHWFTNGITNAVGGTAGLLAGLLSPALARELADWLRGQAAFIDGVIETHGRLPAQAVANIAHPLAVTRHILATAKEMTR